MGRNNDHLVDKLSFEDTAFTLTSSYNKQQTTTTNMVFGSRLSLSAMLALGLCLSQGTATEAAGITQLFNHAVRRFGEKAVENGVPAGVRVGANLAHIPTVPAGNRKLLGIGDAAPIAIHLPFHKPDDFIGEFQTAAGEIVPHYEPNGTPLTSRCSQRSRTRQMQSIVLPWERTLCTAWNSVHKPSPSSLARQSLGSTWTVSRTTLCSRRSP